MKTPLLTKLEEGFSVLRNDQAKKRKNIEVPPNLFHYTTGGGLIGIIESDRMWATNIKYLNDHTELTHAVSLFQKVLESKGYDSEVMTEFKSRAAKTFNAFDGMFDVYVLCFCTSDDLLSQWRGYTGPGGGYSLGLSSKEILMRDIHLSQEQSFTLYPVEYSEENQIRALNSVYESVSNTLETVSQGLNVEQANELIALSCGELRTQLAELLCTFKHSTFSEESEWRAIHIVAPNSNEQYIKFRMGQYGLTPYVCLDLSPMAGINRNTLPINSIRIGPTPNPKLEEKALSLLLRQKKRHFTAVLSSDIPLRT